MRDHNRRGRVDLINRLNAERGNKQPSSLRLIPRKKKNAKNPRTK
jgi:hypothetical protein